MPFTAAPEHTCRPDVPCFECFRAERARHRAQAQVAPGAQADDEPPMRPAAAPFGKVMTARETSHRRAMLVHLQRAR